MSDYFGWYQYNQQQKNLRVLQIVPRPSDGWFATAFLGLDTLLNYAIVINKSFNDCPGGNSNPSGWLGQRLWAGLVGSVSFQGGWNRPNIVIVDNYSAAQVSWRAMVWQNGAWKQTNANNTAYTDYIISLNTVQPLASDPGVGYFSPNDKCYTY